MLVEIIGLTKILWNLWMPWEMFNLNTSLVMMKVLNMAMIVESSFESFMMKKTGLDRGMSWVGMKKHCWWVNNNVVL